MYHHESIQPILTLLKLNKLTEENISVVMAAVGATTPIVKPKLLRIAYDAYCPYLIANIIENVLADGIDWHSEKRYALCNFYLTIVKKYDWWCFNDEPFCRQIFEYCKEVTAEYFAFLKKYELE